MSEQEIMEREVVVELWDRVADLERQNAVLRADVNFLYSTLDVKRPGND